MEDRQKGQGSVSSSKTLHAPMYIQFANETTTIALSLMRVLCRYVAYLLFDVQVDNHRKRGRRVVSTTTNTIHFSENH